MPVNVQATIEPYNDTYDVVNAKHVGVGEGENKKKLSDILNNLPSGTATAPHIGDNGNWFIGDTDTGVKAAGENGKDGVDGKDGANGTNGKDGVTPHIGDNGNWFIGDTDTGVAAGGNGGGEYEIPTFNLVELGLPTIAVGGEAVILETDTTEIMAALGKGAVKFTIGLNVGAEAQADVIMNSVDAQGEYICSYTLDLGAPLILTLMFMEGGIAGYLGQIASGSGGGEYETPTFDLVTLGLPALAFGAEGGVLETDTTEIIAALSEGPVKFIIPMDSGGTATAEQFVMNGMLTSDGSAMCSCLIPEVGAVVYLAFAPGMMIGMFFPLSSGGGGGTTAQPVSIDLSGLDTNGTIVETYADGTSKTTTVEFDASGNPIKITDADGNVTTLTW